MSVSGALFDLTKLTDVSKNVISKMSAEKVLSYALDWAKNNDEKLFELLSRDKEYSKAIFSIDRDVPKPRKDISKFSEIGHFVSFFFDETFDSSLAELPENLSKETTVKVLKAYASSYEEAADKNEWFEKMKELCEPLGFTPNVKEFKKNPESYLGHVGDVSTVVRVAVTGRRNTPDLYSIMMILGKERVLKRLDAAISALSED